MRHVVHDVSAIGTWICWGCVGAVWVIGALAQASRRAGSSAPRSRDISSLATATAALLVLGLPGSLWRALTVSSPWSELAGLVVLLPATAAAIWARAVLGSMWSAAARIQNGHALRTDGPYAITRHPIYTALTAMLAGTALTQGLGRWVAVLLAVVVVLKLKIRAEERLLGERFPEYERYRMRVPELVPRVHLKAGAHRSG